MGIRLAPKDCNIFPVYADEVCDDPDQLFLNPAWEVCNATADNGPEVVAEMNAFWKKGWL